MAGRHVGRLFVVISLAIWAATEETLPHTAAWIALSAFAAGDFIPVVTVSIRRMHDLGLSGLWLLLAIPVLLLYPALAVAVLAGLFCLPGKQAANRFGPASDLKATPTAM